MKLSEIENIDKEFLLASDISPYLGCDPNHIRVQAQADPSKLGFPVTVIGRRVKIPKDGFIFWRKYGNIQRSGDKFYEPKEV